MLVEIIRDFHGAKMHVIEYALQAPSISWLDGPHHVPALMFLILRPDNGPKSIEWETLFLVWQPRANTPDPTFTSPSQRTIVLSIVIYTSIPFSSLLASKVMFQLKVCQS